MSDINMPAEQSASYQENISYATVAAHAEQLVEKLTAAGVRDTQPWQERYTMAGCYAAMMGMPVVMLQPGSKVPLFGGKREAVTDLNELEAMFVKAEKALAPTLQATEDDAVRYLQVPNTAALLTGSYAVIDVDTAKQDGQLRQAYPHLPEYTVKTPGVITEQGEAKHKDGGHIYLRIPPEHREAVLAAPGKIELPGGAELMLHGFYVLVPGCTRKEGKYAAQYSMMEAPVIPDDLLQLIIERGEAQQQRKQQAKQVNPDYDPTQDPIRQWEAAAVGTDPDAWAWAVLQATRCGDKQGNPTYNLPGKESGSFTIDTSQGARVHFWTDDPGEVVTNALAAWNERHNLPLDNRSIGAASIHCAAVYASDWNAFLRGEGVEDAYKAYRTRTSTGVTGFAGLPVEAPAIAPVGQVEVAGGIGSVGSGQPAAAGTALNVVQFPQPQPPALFEDDEEVDDGQLDLPRYPDSAYLERFTADTVEPTALDEVPQTFAKWPEEHAKLEVVWERLCKRVDDLVAELEQAFGCELPDESVLALRINLWPENCRRHSIPPQWSEVPGPERKAKYGQDSFPVNPRLYVALMNASRFHQATFWNVRENHPNASILGALLREYQESSHRLPVGFQCSPRGKTQPANIFAAIISQSGSGKTATQDARTLQYVEEHLREVQEAEKKAAEELQAAQEEQEQRKEALLRLKAKLEQEQELTKKEKEEKKQLEKEVEDNAPRVQPPEQGTKALDLSLGEGESPGSEAAIRNMLTHEVLDEYGAKTRTLKDNQRLYFYWDEAASLASAMGGNDREGNGTGVDTALSSLWSGKANFKSTVGHGRVIAPPKNFHGVRVAATLSLQTKRAQKLMGTVDQGFLQRFLRVPAQLIYEVAITPKIIARPNKVRPQVQVADVPQDGHVTWGEKMQQVDKDNQNTGRTNSALLGDGNTQWFSHVMRMSAVHALMDGRTHVTDDDATVGLYWNAVSMESLKWIAYHLEQEEHKAKVEDAKVRRKAEQAAERAEKQDNARAWRLVHQYLGDADRVWHTCAEIKDATGLNSDTVKALAKQGAAQGSLVVERRGGYELKSRTTDRIRLATRADDQATA